MEEDHNMSYISTRNKYHIALNGVGLLLQGTPERPGYQQGQAAVYGNRFASGDRDYNDLSQWWYFIQTDWSAGFKDSVQWENDGKFYYSTNIDTWSEQGAIKLCRKPAYNPDELFTAAIGACHEGDLAGTIYKFVSTADELDSRPHIYTAPSGENQTFSDISTTTIATSQNSVSQISTRLGIGWFSTVGSGTTTVVLTNDGTSFTDQTANIKAGASLSKDILSSRCHVEAAGVMYVFVENFTESRYALVKTSAKNPTASGDWSLCFEVTATSGIPIACASYNGNIYYMIAKTGYAELWQYNISTTVNSKIQRFNNTTTINAAVGDKMIVELGGKLLITVPNDEIWELNISSLSRIFKNDEFKKVTSGYESNCYLARGCVIQDNKAWWGNLMYDGESFFNTWKNYADDDGTIVPLFADTSSRIWWTSGTNLSLFSTNLNGVSYKGDTDKNFIVLSNFDNIAGVDKMGYSVTILFKPLVSGQYIKVEYLTGEFSTSATWTSLGNASYASDGGTIRSKTLFFPVGTTFNKIWFRIKLEGGGSDTPTMNDIVMEYLPVPTYKKIWTLSINAADEIKMLDGQPMATKGREIRALLEHSWWTKSLLDFQDLDYATTTLSDNPLTHNGTTITVASTADFPEKGRIKIDNEEIFYTGKTHTTFTGCVRGTRGTVAVSHAQNSIVNNAYRVLITDFNARVPIALEERELEYVITLTIKEG